VLLWIYPSHRSTPVLHWTHPSHRFSPVLHWTHPSRRFTPMLLWTHPSHRSTPSASLESSKPLIYPSAPWTHPSHRSTPMFLGLIQATGQIGIIQLYCTCMQCSLHFSAYTLAMQSMVSAFIQHPSKYPSRYIIVQTTAWKDEFLLYKSILLGYMNRLEAGIDAKLLNPNYSFHITF
jgi:hypothetical protein